VFNILNVDNSTASRIIHVNPIPPTTISLF